MSSHLNAENPLHLKIGESVVANIDARPPNSATGIRLVTGVKYDLAASGTWFDAGRGIAAPKNYDYAWLPIALN